MTFVNLFLMEIKFKYFSMNKKIKLPHFDGKKCIFIRVLKIFPLLKLNFNNSVIQMRKEKSKKCKIEGVRVGRHTADRRSKKEGREGG